MSVVVLLISWPDAPIRYVPIPEYTREAAPLLYYLGPELNFSLVDHPNVEAFIRIQHRSGGYGTIAKIDAANADALGLRWKF